MAVVGGADVDVVQRWPEASELANDVLLSAFSAAVAVVAVRVSVGSFSTRIVPSRSNEMAAGEDLLRKRRTRSQRRDELGGDGAAKRVGCCCGRLETGAEVWSTAGRRMQDGALV